VLPKEYTAQALLIIEPPAGTDPRASTAVSPIYLESLKTYERFASSDQLFAQAADRFELRKRWPKRPLERLKRSVLQVEIPRSTKILEIGVTLNDPQKAHAMSLYIAEQAVELNRRINRSGDEEMIREAQGKAQDAARRLEQVETTRARFRRSSPTVDALGADLSELQSMREEVDRLLLSAELTKTEKPGEKSESRAARLRREADDLDRRIGTAAQALAGRRTESDRLDAEYEAAWTAREELEKHLREMQGAIGYRGERLSLLDPGVPPERPSFPNIPLNLIAAAALGIAASLFYLTVEYGLASQKAEMLRRQHRAATVRERTQVS
jgi:uncharacterized protein involved in exopolysaccharide biosynthesis